MEPNKIKLKLTEQEKTALSPALITVAEDLISNENISRSDLAKLYVFSQQNCRMIMQRLEERKNNKSVSLKPETLAKLKSFMDASRVHPLAGGQRFKSEDETLSFLLDLALKFGFKFLEAMLNDDNFKSVTSTMKPADFDDQNRRRKEVSKTLDEKDGDSDGS